MAAATQLQNADGFMLLTSTENDSNVLSLAVFDCQPKISTQIFQLQFDSELNDVSVIASCCISRFQQLSSG